MKNKRNKLLKISMILFGFSLILWSCQQENLLTNIENNNKNSVQKISASKALNEIIQQTNSAKTINKQQNLFKQINTNVFANKTALGNNNTSYNFLLYPKHQNQLKNNTVYFDNLFVSIDKNNNSYTHILRYIPTKDWLINSNDLSKYSGKIQYLSNSREVLSSIELAEGTPIETSKKEQNNNNKARGGCILTYKMTVCGALDGDSLSCTHFYELKCAGGSSSGGGTSSGGYSGSDTNPDFGNLNNGDDSISGGGSGSSSTGNGNSITGAPIVGFCPDGTPSDSNGNCASEIDDQIINLLTGKAKCVYDKLLSSGISNFHNMITDLFIEFGDNNIGGRDLTFKMSSDLPDNIWGDTKIDDETGDYIIYVNSNVMSRISSIEVAAVLIHEISHAFLGKHYYNSNASFFDLYQNYINDTGIENFSHNIMKDQFINRMATVLKNYHPSLFSSFEDYKILCSRGVFELSDLQKTHLINTINIARQNDKNCP